jgi:mono/diheme cytochrome c family protein
MGTGLVVLGAFLWPGPSRVQAAELDGARKQAATNLFTRSCIRCHGEDGKGDPGRVTLPTIPNFTDPAWQQSRSNAQMKTSILEGKNRQMPAHGGEMSDADAADLVLYVRGFVPPAEKEADPKPDPEPEPDPKLNPDPKLDPKQKMTPKLNPTGDFERRFNALASEFDDLQNRSEKLAVEIAKERVAKARSPKPKAKPNPKPKVVAAPITERPVTPVTVVPITERPWTPKDAARGRELFAGRRLLARGGAACISCHAVHDNRIPEGGRLGPDLTKLSERAGGSKALLAQLGSPRMAAMHPVYKEHPLESEEVLGLAAYLEEADKGGAEQAAGVPWNLLFLGLGGAVLGLLTLNFVWRPRVGPGRQPPLDGGVVAMPARSTLSLRSGKRVAVPTPAVGPELEHVPEECPVPGL